MKLTSAVNCGQINLTVVHDKKRKGLEWEQVGSALV